MARWLKSSADAAEGVGSVDGLRAADLADAMGRLHRHLCHIPDLVSPTPGRVLFGPAGARGVKAEDDGYRAQIRREEPPPPSKGGPG